MSDQFAPAPPTRGEICDEAKKTITQGRNDIYGQPEDAFATIANFWTCYLIARQEPPGLVTPVMVADMMELLKIARSTAQGHHPDNSVDRVGYAAIAGELAGREAAKNLS